MEPQFLNDIILISPGNNKKRIFMHSNTTYSKNIFMLDSMASTKPASPPMTKFNEFLQTDMIFFSSEQPCWLFED